MPNSRRKRTTTLRICSSYSEGGDNAALKSFAAKVLPVINQHKQEAERIEESL